jgi:hypothetical protein
VRQPRLSLESDTLLIAWDCGRTLDMSAARSVLPHGLRINVVCVELASLARFFGIGDFAAIIRPGHIVRRPWSGPNTQMDGPVGPASRQKWRRYADDPRLPFYASKLPYESESCHARISWSADLRAADWHGVVPGLLAPATWNPGNEIRSDRQDGFPHPALCRLLCLYTVRHGVRLARRRRGTVFQIRGHRVARRAVVLGGAAAIRVDP